MSGVNPYILPQVFADVSVAIEALQRGSIASIARAGGTSEQISHASAVLGDFALWARAQEMRARAVGPVSFQRPRPRLVSSA